MSENKKVVSAQSIQSFDHLKQRLFAAAVLLLVFLRALPGKHIADEGIDVVFSTLDPRVTKHNENMDASASIIH